MGLTCVGVCVCKRKKEGKLTPLSLSLSLFYITRYGLSWNPLAKGQILSSAEDHLICYWDINGFTKDRRTLEASRVFTGHEEATVNDVAWHGLHDKLFASVGDDRQLLIWDMRAESSSKAAHSVLAHPTDINCVSFNPTNEFVLATGSADKVNHLLEGENNDARLDLKTSSIILSPSLSLPPFLPSSLPF